MRSLCMGLFCADIGFFIRFAARFEGVVSSGLNDAVNSLKLIATGNSR